jgi:hypothetical protein
MLEIVRDCPGCDGQREFAQHHPFPERCPDGAGELCPEWFCVACGAGLLIGDSPVSSMLAATAARRGATQLDRVA